MSLPTAPPQIAGAHPWVTLLQLQGLLSFVGTALVVIGAVTVSALFVPKIRLIRERNEAQEWSRRLEGRVTAQSADLTALLDQMGELRREVAAARSEAAETRAEAVELRAEVTRARAEAAESTLFIASIIVHFKRRGSIATMPEPPASISESVMAEVHARELASDAASQGAAGVVAPSSAAVSAAAVVEADGAHAGALATS